MQYLKAVGVGILAILGIYAIWAALIPMAIGNKAVEREVIQQSPQYVDSKKSAILKLNTKYHEASGAHKKAIKAQMCEEANDIPKSEWPKSINLICQ